MFPLKWCVNQRGFLTLKCGSSTFCSLLLLLLFPFAIRWEENEISSEEQQPFEEKGDCCVLVKYKRWMRWEMMSWNNFTITTNQLNAIKESFFLWVVWVHNWRNCKRMFTSMNSSSYVNCKNGRKSVSSDHKLIIISIYGMQRRCAILENCTRQPLYRWPDVNEVTWRSETPHRAFVEQLFQCLLCWFSPSYYCSKFYSSFWVLDGACMRLTPLLLCGCIIKKTRILLHVSYKVLMAVYKN